MYPVPAYDCHKPQNQNIVMSLGLSELKWYNILENISSDWNCNYNSEYHVNVSSFCRLSNGYFGKQIITPFQAHL